jgi:type II secretory pathway component PulF
MAVLHNLMKYEKEVRDASIYPTVVKWVYTGIGTFFLAIVPIMLSILASLRQIPGFS